MPFVSPRPPVERRWAVNRFLVEPFGHQTVEGFWQVKRLRARRQEKIGSVTSPSQVSETFEHRKIVVSNPSGFIFFGNRTKADFALRRGSCDQLAGEKG